MTEAAKEAGDPAELSYGYRPSVLGAPWQFRLEPDAIAFEVGRRSGRLRYDQVRKVRMSFRPTTMQAYSFVTEVWPLSGSKLTISSTSWKSMVEQQRQDAPYLTFVTALHERLARAVPGAQYVSGAAAYLYWPGLVVFVAAALGFAILIVRALQAGSLAGAAFVGAFLALFLWQIGNYFRRNRPGIYRPDAPPAQLLPRRKG